MKDLTQSQLEWINLCAEDEVERDVENFQSWVSNDETKATVKERDIPLDPIEKLDYIDKLSNTNLFFLVFFGIDENSHMARLTLVGRYRRSQFTYRDEILARLINDAKDDE